MKFGGDVTRNSVKVVSPVIFIWLDCIQWSLAAKKDFHFAKG
jgi:hypothetical protein